MPKPSSLLWRWSRPIPREQESHWTDQLGAAGELNWMIVEKPGWKRLKLEAYFRTERDALRFKTRWDGRVEKFAPTPAVAPKPIRIDERLEIVHEEKTRRTAGQLVIPYGIAFGSGEHATTLMLLRALAREGDLASRSILDLGTGSGVLALAARMLGAKKITATDFDPAAIRTARRNELLNFPTRRVRWEVADVKRLRASPRFELIVANLFSGILVDAAPRIVRALESDGELWLSGVLRSQQAEVAAAYRKAGLRPLKTTTRGKWVMQQWKKPVR